MNLSSKHYNKDLRIQASIIVSLIFLLNPLLGLILSFFVFKTDKFKYFFMSFFFLLGYSITFEAKDVDSYGYALSFISWSYEPFSELIKSYLNADFQDIYQRIIFNTLSVFTNNPKFLFGLLALIYGYFYFKCYELCLCKSRTSYLEFFLIFIYLFAIPYTNLNGVRFWTAGLYFVFIALRYLKDRELKYLLLLGLSLFIHFSFVMIYAFFLIYAIFGNKTRIYYFVFLLSVFISVTSVINLLANVGFLSGVFSFKLENYTVSDYAQFVIEGRSAASFMFKLLKQYSLVYMFFIVLIMKIKYFNLKFDAELNNLHSLLLLLFVFLNLFSEIPSIGRFISVALMISLYYLLQLYRQNRTFLMKILILFSLPTIAITIYESFELATRLFSSEIVYGSFLSILLEQPNI